MEDEALATTRAMAMDANETWYLVAEGVNRFPGFESGSWVLLIVVVSTIYQ
jgi:hypothetical protein